MERIFNSGTDDQAYRVSYLIIGYIWKTLTREEHEELDQWINASDRNMQLFEELTDEANLQANLDWMEKLNTDRKFKRLQEKWLAKKKVRKISIGRSIAIAASVTLILAVFIVYQNNWGKKTSRSTMVESTDIAPGGDKATLTLADGSVIDLTSARNGLIHQAGSADILKTDNGHLLYETGSASEVPAALHTLRTPSGGQFSITLPDGSRIWLNAETELKFPSQFTSNERRVELRGEAFFEVAKNSEQPFRVVLSDSTVVTVLGTEFNVMSYDNEASRQVSLLEGSVSLHKNRDSHVLEPGMQGQVSNNRISVSRGFDSEEVTGWKNGVFVFKDAPIEIIMKQVERWYDAKVVFKGHTSQLFNASINRKEPLSKLLHLLELTGHVHFKIENKTVYVLP